MKPTLIRSVSNQRGTISFAPKQIAILVLVLLIIFVVVFCIIKHATNQEEKVPSYSGDEVQEVKSLYEQLLNEIPQTIAGATVKRNAVEEWNLFALEHFENTVFVIGENQGTSNSNTQTSDNSYAEIYLINNEERRDARETYYELGSRMYALDLTIEDVVIKQEENIILGIFSKRAKELEKQLDTIVSTGGTVINCDTTVTWSETETTEESVIIRVAVENNQATNHGTNIETVVAYVADGSLNQTSNEYELTKNEATNQYEAEIKFEDLGGREGGYSFSVLVEDDCGNEEYYLGTETIVYSPTGVLSTNVYEKEDGRIAAQITALEKGEVLITATPGTPSVGDANWAKYEAGKEYVLDTIEKGTEKVYVWYKAGDQITNVANSGFSVMSYTDGIGVLMEGYFRNGASDKVFDRSGCTIMKSEVVNIILSNNQTPPAGDIVETLDVSQNRNGSVTAWFVRNAEDSTKYDLYIGGNGTLIAPAYSKYLFAYFQKSKTFQGLEFLEVGNRVTNMEYMFFNCKGLTNLEPMRDWDISGITDLYLYYMFGGCSEIISLEPLSNWDVSSVQYMIGMFYGCSGITDLTPIRDWNMSNVKNIGGMFLNCTSISSIEPLSDWDVSSITDMSSTFSMCSGITDLTPISGWDVSSVQDMSGMFYICSGITDLTPISGWDVSSVTDMSSMFDDCKGITNLTPISGWDVSSVQDMSNMFSNCSQISDLTPLTNWTVDNVIDMSGMFGIGSIISGMQIASLEPLKAWNVGNVTNMSGMFEGCDVIADFGPLRDWNTGNVTNMSEMFARCEGITNIDLSSWNTERLTNVKGMFYGCASLKYLILGETFAIIQSSKAETSSRVYYFAGPATSIITPRTEPLTLSPCSSSYEQYCYATLFVKNTDTTPSLESTFEAADTENMFGPERIEEVISLIGENPLTVSLGTTYEDPGVNVGLYPASDLVNYPDLKLTLETDASAVENALKAGNTGEYVVTYTLKHDGTEFCKETRTVKIEKAQNPFIMEWTIPAGADGNDASGNPQTIIQLPIIANGANNYTVDWGDGQKETFDSTADLPSHTYHNTTEQAYVIKITGRVQTFGYGSFSTGSMGNDERYRPAKEKYSEYYPFTQYLAKIIAWGELEAERYSFAFCKNLKEVASPTAETFKNVTRFDFAFMYCSELKSIPEDLFAGGDKVKDFSCTFYDSGLSGEIPKNLFANNQKVKDFSSTFDSCSGLRGEIPENLFANNQEVTSFLSTFSGCSGLSGEIPKDLFANNQEVTDFRLTFSGCSGLSGEIPKDLFAKNSKVTSFYYTFSRCNGLSGEIPEDLFVNNLAVTSFDGTFIDCSGLSGEIPENLFANNQEVTSFMSTFSGCRSLSGTIPESLFANNPRVILFGPTFSGCSGLTGMIPADLFANNPLAKYFYQTFYGCSGLIAGEITLNSQNITNMKEMFRGCSNLESLVFGSEFKDFTGVNMFAGCDNLKAIILLNDASSTDQVGTILEELNNNQTSSSDKDLGLPNQTIIYVASEETEKVYEQAWSNVSEDRIRPVIEVKEPNPTIVGLGKPFVDPGYTVAGFETTEKEKYEQYGFYVVIDGADESLTATVGTKEIHYYLEDR